MRTISTAGTVIAWVICWLIVGATMGSLLVSHGIPLP